MHGRSLLDTAHRTLLGVVLPLQLSPGTVPPMARTGPGDLRAPEASATLEEWWH